MLTVRLLGPVDVVTGAGEPISVVSVLQARLLAALALRTPAFVNSHQLVEAVWGHEVTPNTIHTAVARLRKTLGLSDVAQGLVTRGASYRLDADTDTRQFRDMVEQADLHRGGADHREALSSYDNALALWRGEPPELGDETLVQGDLRLLSRLRLDAALGRLECLLALGKPCEVDRAVDSLLDDHPLHERLNELKVLAVRESQGVGPALDLLELTRQRFKDDDTHFAAGYRLAQELSRQPQPAGETMSGWATAPPPRVDGTNLDESGGVVTKVSGYLPASTYATFIPRQDLLEELNEGITLDLPVLALIGIGGNGKSALAHRFATLLWEGGAPFEHIVWVSDKERPGSTDLSGLISMLALATSSPRISSGDPAANAIEAHRLLRRAPTLIIVDNYESVTDPRLTDWLLAVPGASKALITSITHVRALEDYCYEIEVAGLEEHQAVELFRQHLRHLRIRGIPANDPELVELWRACHGNPRLMEWALGQLRRYSLAEVIAEIAQVGSADTSSATSERSDVVLTHLFRGSWTSLTPSAQDVLVALSCFPFGVSCDVTRTVSGHPVDFDAALQELQDLFFIRRVPRGSGKPWYVADPLAASRARHKAERDGTRANAIYDRWLSYCESEASRIGFCPSDVDRLTLLDPPGVRRNLEFAMTWAIRHGRPEATVVIARDVRYWYYVRGLWANQPNVHLLRAQAAALLGDVEEEFDALVYLLNIAAKQENRAEFNSRLPRVEFLLKEHEGSLGDKRICEYRHARALYMLAIGEVASAEEQWRLNLAKSDALGPENYNANLRWLATCVSRVAGNARNGEARALLEEARCHATAQGFSRALAMADLQLAELNLQGDDVAIDDILHALTTMTSAIAILNDRFYTAQHHFLLGLARRGGESAQESFHRAAALFEELGLTDRAFEARREEASCEI